MTTHVPSDNATGIDDLEADIARQRADLAHTVDDLRDRLDVKARAQERAHELKATARDRTSELADRATTDAGRPRPELVAAGSAGALAVVIAIVWRIRRHRKESR